MSPGDRAGRVPGPARSCGTRGATVRDNRRSRRSVCVFGRTWHDGFDCLAIGFRAGRPTRSEIPDAFPLPCVPFSGARRAERIAVSVPTDCEIFGSWNPRIGGASCVFVCILFFFRTLVRGDKTGRNGNHPDSLAWGLGRVGLRLRLASDIFTPLSPVVRPAIRIMRPARPAAFPATVPA